LTTSLLLGAPHEGHEPSAKFAEKGTTAANNQSADHIRRIDEIIPEATDS